MIECIFTIDYEIYGDGRGSMRDLIYEPTNRLINLFQKRNVCFVAFVEAAELEKVSTHRTDEAIDDVNRQVREMYRNGHEIGLHLHPQWYNAEYVNGRWELDHSEYNLCTLPRERITQIIDRSCNYFRDVLGVPDFTPLSFRAGNWLFQPSQSASIALAEKGVKIDSSVSKGLVQRYHGLDYRPALKNGYYWNFGIDVNKPQPNGALLEIPIYTKMVPFWRMLTSKRVHLQRKASTTNQRQRQKVLRLLDRLRWKYPLKFDICRMEITELESMFDEVIRADQKSPDSLKPLVAIGHTKDLVDFDTIETFLAYLKQNGIKVSTFVEIYERYLNGARKQAEGIPQSTW